VQVRQQAHAVLRLHCVGVAYMLSSRTTTSSPSHRQVSHTDSACVVHA
jgi:hypothetical protein